MIVARCAPYAAALTAGLALGWAATALGDPGLGQPVTVERTVSVTVQARANGHSARYWLWRKRQADMRIMSLRRERREMYAIQRRLRRASHLRWQPTVRLAVAYARAVYGVDQTRRTYCESTGNVWASNGTHFGLLQFSASTWASTPFRGFSPYDPVAAELAGGWMVTHGRSGEWACGL